MCPACLTALALIPIAAGSAGGVAAVIVQKFSGRHPEKESVKQKPADVSANKEDNR